MTPALGDNARQQLLSLIERVENRAEAKKEIADEISEIFSEAKGSGYDVAALRTIIRMRKEDPAKRLDRENAIEAYALALGIE